MVKAQIIEPVHNTMKAYSVDIPNKNIIRITNTGCGITVQEKKDEIENIEYKPRETIIYETKNRFSELKTIPISIYPLYQYHFPKN